MKVVLHVIMYFILCFGLSYIKAVWMHPLKGTRCAGYVVDGIVRHSIVPYVLQGCALYHFELQERAWTSAYFHYGIFSLRHVFSKVMLSRVPRSY